MESIHSLLITLKPAITLLYAVALTTVCLFGLHRFHLLVSYLRHRKNIPQPTSLFDQLPKVTIQLPMYNEPLVARRVIEATCQIDYPADRLEIQVVDDSTDSTSTIAMELCEELAAAEHDIHYVHRDNRMGYKAGALEEALAVAKGEFIAVFDADFVPPQDFLTESLHYFTDPKVGMVQACWDHLNRSDSLLTRAQAIFLDGHFLIEHTARNRSGRWINFNGTAGVWRRAAIEDAGGWEHDTITEDVDLSYRAQLAGWQFVYLPDLKCPAQLPPHVADFKTQQHRWAKGTMQVAKKILPRILRADISLLTKLEAAFHLTGPIVYPCVVLLALLALPVLYLNIQLIDSNPIASIALSVTIFALTTLSVASYYIASQALRKRDGQSSQAGRMISGALHVPILFSLGIGISLSNARGVIAALLGHSSEFVRTPKSIDDSAPLSKRSRANLGLPLIELAMCVYMIACIQLAYRTPGALWGLPFLILFALGFAYIGFAGLPKPMPRLKTES